MQLLPLLGLAPILLVVAYTDLRYMRIPNVLSVLAVLLFSLTALISPPDDLLVRVVAAGTVLALGFGAFCLGLFGGGDVKILSALMLFVPAHTLPLFGYVFSAAMLLGMMVLFGLRQIPITGNLSWKSMSGGSQFPMGISIAMAGLLHPIVVLLAG